MVELQDYLSKRGLLLPTWESVDNAEENKYIKFFNSQFQFDKNYIFISEENTGKKFFIHKIFKTLFEQNRNKIEKKTFTLLNDIIPIKDAYFNDHIEFLRLLKIDYLAIKLYELDKFERKATRVFIEERMVNQKITYLMTDFVYIDDFDYKVGLQGIVNKYFTQVVVKNTKTYNTTKKIIL